MIVTPVKLVVYLSTIIRKEFPSLEEFLWGDSFWGDGYFVESVGTVNFETIREYVKNQ